MSPIRPPTLRRQHTTGPTTDITIGSTTISIGTKAITINSSAATPTTRFAMAGTETASKVQVLRSLNNAIQVFDGVAETCGTVEDAADLPKAFPVVIGHLPRIATTFKAIKSHITEAGQDAGDDRKMYYAIKQVADECHKQAAYLAELLDAVQSTDGTASKLERYREAVTNGGNEKLETVMKELLRSIFKVAKPPLVGEVEITELKAALDEVTRLPPSLSGDSGRNVVLRNYGKGNQFYHGGKGHQNHCAGGVQITGDNKDATFQLPSSNS